MNIYLPMTLLVLSVVIYQVAFRLVPKDLSSWHVLFIVYTLGALICFLLGLQEKTSIWQTLKSQDFRLTVK